MVSRQGLVSRKKQVVPPQRITILSIAILLLTVIPSAYAKDFLKPQKYPVGSCQLHASSPTLMATGFQTW